MMRDGVFVVPTERHVERYAREGASAETRTAFAARLLVALAPDVKLAGAEETRLALATSLPAVARDDALLRRLLERGGPAWLRTVDAVGAAIAAVRASGATVEALRGAERAGGAVARRAGLLHRAMSAVDARLADAGLADALTASGLLARALAAGDPDEVGRVVGAKGVTARWIVIWSMADLAWWRALDDALAKRGGRAIIEVPAIDYALDLKREPAPLDVVLEEIARGLDEPPRTVSIDAPLGDLRLAGELANPARVELRQAADAHAQARAIADAVHTALRGAGTRRGGEQLELLFADRTPAAPIEAIAIALPSLDEETLRPIRAALDDAGIAFHDPRGAGPTGAGVVTAALDVLTIASRRLPRIEVARLLRSTYVDLGAAALREDLARALEETPTARATDDVAALEATARGQRTDELATPERARLARSIGEALARAELATTRTEHAVAALRLWKDLGIEARVRAAPGEHAIFTRDDPPSGLARAEMRALARDAHAWDALVAAVAAYAEAVVRLGVGDLPASAETFRHELAQTLDADLPRSAASRAGAVRLATLSELAGEPLDLLIVADANEGILPSAPGDDVFLPEALAARLREHARGASPPSPQVRSSREMALLAIAAARARRVVLCYRDRDEAGTLLAPAPIIAWLERAGVARSRFMASPIAARPLTGGEALLAALASDPVTAAARDPDAARRARIEREREAFFEGENSEPTILIGRLEPDPRIARILADETGGGDRPLAITALEKIATCAFQGYAAAVLRAGERRVSSEAPDAREGGTILHGALAAAFLATASLWKARPRDCQRIRARAGDAAAVFLARDAAASGLRRLTLDRVRENVDAVVAWSLDDDEWDFALAEQSFGDRGAESWPPLSLTGDATTVLLRGSIDRVDVAHARGRAAVRAIDYKSSDRTAKHATKELGRTTFQVALYGKIAAERLGATEVSGVYLPAHAASLPLKKRRLDSNAKAWTEAHAPVVGRPRAEAWALETLRVFREGALAPMPIEKGACERCSFDGGCRKPRFVIRGSAPDEP